ncbi:MAG: formate dehydrogenase accessory sulfurtransferase FdhD, partial [Chloroflexota bacterium]
MMESELRKIEYYQYHSGELNKVETDLIVERPVVLYVNGSLWLTFMCTPNFLEALAVGFLFNEGVIKSIEQVADIHICDNGNVIDVWLNHNVERPKEWKRTSGCTGGYTAIDINSLNPEIVNGGSINSKQVRRLVERLFDSQELYRKTGGVHTSILTDGDQVTIFAEDVGRHNSLDKIAGRVLLEDVKLHQKLLLTTGRISSDMLQKAARIGAGIVVSR